MVHQLATKDNQHYDWLDVSDPDEKDLKDIAARYNLQEQSVQDATEADHLPKHERLKGYTFSILRIYSPDNDMESDTVQELTNKVSIFVSKDFIISVHRKEWSALGSISKHQVQPGDCETPLHVYIEIIRAALLTFDQPASKLNKALDYYEEHIFLKDKRKPILKGLYFLKRKVDVIRRILLLSFDIIDQVDPEENSTAYTRDVRDLYVKQQSIFDSLSENINHLLNFYFNAAAQKTNETIRILTIFSVFFLPLTFIVGIYGMNFKAMPELNWRYGYPGVYVLMAVVTISIYVWFKRKKWL
ncbi:hypothetical protein LZZ85_03435 [Terrimonas sp. NA20]|uniref:Magnesium transporter CorA n=1 Tax=Terrimonas ginsenosidimutans TaxID=2908004 RepID=A0ABS9KLW5_9BACT|nr:CorA family divalent cation transporter [Terrimonas ginsenosidimutans]MCG2613312.1 hypothetical protein [Terrimonas ginsenosidimutans]